MNKSIIKKEFRESLYESKGLWMIAASSVILSALCFIVVNIKEGSVLAQGDILQYAIKAVLFLSLMVSMVLGASSFAMERESNTMESLLLTPVSSKSLAFAKYCGVLIIGVILYLVSIPYLMAIGKASGQIINAVTITLIAGLLLELAFVAVSIVLSILIKSSKAGILTSILVFIIICFPAMLQGLMRQSAIGRLLLAIDPMAACFNLMKAVLADGNSLLACPQYLLTLFIFPALAIAVLYFMSEKISLKGES